MSTRTWSTLLLGLAFLSTRAANAQCLIDRVLLDEAFENAIASQLGPVVEDRTTQISAPSSSGSSPSLTDRPSFPSFLGMAIDNGLIKSSDNAITVDLNLFAFLSMAQPTVLTSPAAYQRYEGVRRWGGSVVFGGNGARFDNNGNEITDPLPSGTRRTALIHYELRYQLTGSRDPRDRENARRISRKIVPGQRRSHDVLDQIVKNPAFAAVAQSQGNDGCVDAKKVEALFESADIKPLITSLVTEVKGLSDAEDAAIQELEKRSIWSVVVGGVRQDQRLGPNSIKLALRGELHNQTVNLEWRRSEKLARGLRPSVFKGGWELSKLVLEHSRFAPLGLDLSASASWEAYRDVPAAKHDSVQKVNVKMEYRIKEGIKLPISVTWANHKDLVTGESELRGHVGLTIDWSNALKVGKASATGSGSS